jgi:transcription initiation factor TFIID subunit TAF12
VFNLKVENQNFSKNFKQNNLSLTNLRNRQYRNALKINAESVLKQLGFTACSSTWRYMALPGVTFLV